MAEQQQHAGYERKVNESQKMLPNLGRRIALVSTTEENAAEQVLCGQTVGERLTLNELKKCEAVLKGTGNAPTSTATAVDHDKIHITAKIRSNFESEVITNQIRENFTNFNEKSTDLGNKIIDGLDNGEIGNSEENNAANKDSSEGCEITPKTFSEGYEGSLKAIKGATAQTSSSSKDISQPSTKIYNKQSGTEKSSTKLEQAVEIPTSEENNDVEYAIEKDDASIGTTNEIFEKVDVLNNLDEAEDLENVEDEEYEEVELIKIPEDAIEDELILPDSADETEYSLRLDHDNSVENLEDEAGKNAENDIDDAPSDKSVSLRDQQEETINSDSNQDYNKSQLENDNSYADDADYEEVNIQHPETEESCEKLLCARGPEENNRESVEFALAMNIQSITVEESGTVHSDDPLGQLEGSNELGKEATSHANNEEIGYYDKEAIAINEILDTPRTTGAYINQPEKHTSDEDEVQIIESRNSPICLDTDDEDEINGQKQPTVTAAINGDQANTEANIVTLQNSTDRNICPPEQAQNSNEAVAETIELLDSSEGEQSDGGNQQRPKRHIRRIAVPPNIRKVLIKIPPQSVSVYKKRRLLPAVPAPKQLKISQVMSGGAVPLSCRVFGPNSSMPRSNIENSPSKKSVIPPSFKPTPQSNFLNAVNLQPTAASDATNCDNPLAFSATISNRNIIIPNAFYANRRTTAKEEEDVAVTALTTSWKGTKQAPSSVTQQQERVYREWLDEFIKNFANPQQIASHTCLVLLQGALKYKVFARIKDLRTMLNTKACASSGITDAQLTREMYNAFYTDDCRLSGEGLRFCQGACTQIGKNVTLMTDGRTGRITTRTSTFEDLLAKYCGINIGGATADDKRKRQKDDEEYTPAKYYEKKVEKNSTGQGERRKSLRQHRTRCYDETYLYNEPEEAEEEKPPTAEQSEAVAKRRHDAQMMALVQRKAEEKRREAKRQRQQQVKSFESAYIEMFANAMKGKKVAATAASTCVSSVQKRSITAVTQIISDDDDNESLEDGEPRSHRIYKVVPTRILSAPNSTQNPAEVTDNDELRSKRGRPRKQEFGKLQQPSQTNSTIAELITCDSTSGDSGGFEEITSQAPVPKNTNVNCHSTSKLADWCKICNTRIPRTVSHYVNEHPDCEVYTSRLSKITLRSVRKQGGQLMQMRRYLNGQEQYEAECLFCCKTCCFKIPYWYQHYSMHTGEYAYRCSGCNIRKTTRSAIMSHVNQPCRKRGKLLEDYTYNPRASRIEMRICTLCNYMQLNRRNVLKHLRTQHSLKDIQPKHIESIILLRMPEEMNIMPQVQQQPVAHNREIKGLSNSGNNSDQMAMTFNYDQFEGIDQATLWDDGDPTDDLSYMICGMLDVELRNGDD